MKNYVNDLIDMGLGNVIDITVDKFIMEDATYKQNQISGYQLKEKLLDTFTEEQKNIFEDYVEFMMLANERACHLAYLVGARNTIQFLSETNAIKDSF